MSTIAASEAYSVTWVPVTRIAPSPENDSLYGAIEHDEQMDALIESIEKRSLEEPLIVSGDGYIMSGHRRFYAIKRLGWSEVPVRYRHNVLWAETAKHEWRRVLAEYNPQRIKSVGSLLKEAMLRNDLDEDPFEREERRRAERIADVESMDVLGTKRVRTISRKKREFLEAAQAVIGRLEPHWPLSVRQIHYRLLNKPPLISKPERSSKPLEHYRYRNDRRSYEALVQLLKQARYRGEVSMACIDDPTRPQSTYRSGWTNVNEFIHEEIHGFLHGYHRSKLQGQPVYVEVFGEKSTLYRILRQACSQYEVPLSIGRGFCSTPVWRDVARRFRRSGCESMALIIVSDYDPEGFELADDAIRTLRDLWGVPVEGHRVAVTASQIQELGLTADFNPAKDSSSRYKSFVKRTGDERTWEVEALDPDYLIEKVKSAIETRLDMDLFERVQQQELEEIGELSRIRADIVSELDIG